MAAQPQIINQPRPEVCRRQFLNPINSDSYSSLNINDLNAMAALDTNARLRLQHACARGVLHLGEIHPQVLHALGRQSASCQMSALNRLMNHAPTASTPDPNGIFANNAFDASKRGFASQSSTPYSGWSAGGSFISTWDGESSTQECRSSGSWDWAKDDDGVFKSSEDEVAVPSDGHRSWRRTPGTGGHSCHAPQRQPCSSALRVEDMITGKPGNLRVEARGKLDGPQAAVALIDALEAKLSCHGNNGHDVGVFQLDLAENTALTMDNFRQLFNMLSRSRARIDRISLSGCTGVNDAVIGSLAHFLFFLDARMMPLEIDLSDGSITTEGFQLLMQTIECSTGFPALRGYGGAPLPLKLRLENNFINQAAIQAYLEKGLAEVCSRHGGPPGPGVKVRLLDDRREKSGSLPSGIPFPAWASEAGAKHRTDIMLAMELLEACLEMVDEETVHRWESQVLSSSDPMREAHRIQKMCMHLSQQGFAQPASAMVPAPMFRAEKQARRPCATQETSQSSSNTSPASSSGSAEPDLLSMLLRQLEGVEGKDSGGPVARRSAGQMRR
mmetsp:Transcript_15802/g.40774  ORF Transcript_15802/g.40774 Transcript_15802/m.40774 type:complete len:558 (-) Transcript_15802:54-1727(-)